MATTLKNRQITMNAPQGFLLNGKISVTDTGSGLTVAIKTMAGSDPSASDPVYCRIGDTVRSITAALSVTKADGTNWMNAGATELATKEIDYFVYLGYNATDGVVIAFSRIPFANQYSDFSVTTTNEKYAAISTITTAAATDYYEVVGRFAATLSAGAGYTWSVPTFTAINLIQRPIYETRTFVPVGTVSGGVNGTTTMQAKLVGSTVKLQGHVAVSSGGSGIINVATPFTAKTASNINYYGGAKYLDSGTIHSIMISVVGTNTAYVNFWFSAAGSFATSTTPITWANGDTINFSIEYEI